MAMAIYLNLSLYLRFDQENRFMHKSIVIEKIRMVVLAAIIIYQTTKLTLSTNKCCSSNNNISSSLQTQDTTRHQTIPITQIIGRSWRHTNRLRVTELPILSMAVPLELAKAGKLVTLGYSKFAIRLPLMILDALCVDINLIDYFTVMIMNLFKLNSLKSAY